MNLESKELPKSFLVQVIWEWLTIRQQTMLSPHPHTSVTSLCAETMQSGWWVLSVISCWKIFIKCRAHGGNTGCRDAVKPALSNVVSTPTCFTYILSFWQKMMLVLLLLFFSMLKTQDKSSYCTGKGKKRKGRITMGTYGVAWGAWGSETTGKLS